MVRLFKLFRILFLPPEHLCPWTRTPLLHGSCGCRSQVSCQYCGSSYSFRVHHILHQASQPDTVRNILNHLSEHRRVVCPPPSNCTGHDLSSLYVGNYVQFDEFTPRDNASLGILPLCILIMATPVASPSSDPRA